MVVDLAIRGSLRGEETEHIEQIGHIRVLHRPAYKRISRLPEPVNQQGQWLFIPT